MVVLLPEQSFLLVLPRFGKVELLVELFVGLLPGESYLTLMMARHLLGY